MHCRAVQGCKAAVARKTVTFERRGCLRAKRNLMRLVPRSFEEISLSEYMTTKKKKGDTYVTEERTSEAYSFRTHQWQPNSSESAGINSSSLSFPDPTAFFVLSIREI